MAVWGKKAETEADEAMALAGKRAKLANALVVADDLTGFWGGARVQGQNR